jgi:ribosome-binding factor A
MTRKRFARRSGRASGFESDTTRPEESPDDLVTSYFGDAREDRGGRRSRGSERALGQLRREIERTLSCGLAAARDPRLRDLVILGVAPAPDASCFEVTVAPLEPLTPEAYTALVECLHGARGELRAELAGSLQRKRTPELRFTIAAAEDGEP